MPVEKKSKGITRWSQLKANLKLHFLRKIRRPFGTTVELLLPIIFVFLCFLAPAPQPLQSYAAVKESDAVSPWSTKGLGAKVKGNTLFVKGAKAGEFKGEAKKWMENKDALNEWNSVVLKDGGGSGIDILGEVEVAKFSGKELEATIRVPQYEGFVKLPSIKKESTPKSMCRDRPKGLLPKPENCPTSAYFYSGHAGILGLVEGSYLQKYSPNDIFPEFKNYKMNYAAMSSYKENRADRNEGRHKHLIFAEFPILLTFFLSLLLPFFLRAIIEEKEEDLKGVMVIMGLKKSVYWSGWIITYTIEALLISLIGAIPIAFYLYAGLNYGVVAIILFMYCMSLITFGSMMSTLLTKSTSAVIWGLTVACIMAIIVQLVYSEWNIWSWIFGVCSAASFACCFNLLTEHFKSENVHGSFAHLFALKDEHGLAIYVYVLVLLGQTIVYFFIAMWFDGIIPSEFGIHRDPWYCFKPQHKKPSAEDKKLQFDELDHESRQNLEPAQKRHVTISIHKVMKSFHKRFKEKVVALEDITLHFCKGEIIALVGGNASGKTTLFRILTGVNRPTSGEARLMGCNTSNPLQMSTVRPFLGICRQDDVAFKHLTIYEHLEYFARLKGIPVKKIDKRIKRYTKALDLDDFLDMPFSHLPKGIRRKLCFLNAFIGEPKILLLDDPSSGLDPISRRRMWSLLKRDQADRTVIISSHILNDADALADRTVVLSNGKIKCAGTTDFILGKYSRGYHLRFTLRMASQDVIEYLEKSVTNIIPDSEVTKSHGNELSFVLPLHTKKSFEVLFDALDKDVKGHNDVIDYGLSTPTLEHIFYGFHRSLYKRTPKAQGHAVQPESRDISHHSIRKSHYNVRVKSSHHFGQEFKALSRLRYIKKANDFCSFTPLILLPMIILLFTTIFLGIDRETRTLVLKDSGKDSEYNDKVATMQSSNAHIIPESMIGWLKKKRPETAVTIKVTESSSGDGDVLSRSEATTAAALVGISFAFIPAGLMIEYIGDREIGARKLLYIVGSSPVVYFASFVSFYGAIMVVISIYYATLLGISQIPVLSAVDVVLVQLLILLWNMIPSFLFVAAISYLFPRALTLTAYFFVILIGAIPFGIAEQFISQANVFTAVHVAFAFLSPIYIPFGMALVFFHQLDHGKTIGSVNVFVLILASLFHCGWLIPLWLADQQVNGKPLWCFKPSTSHADEESLCNTPYAHEEHLNRVKKKSREPKKLPKGQGLKQPPEALQGDKAQVPSVSPTNPKIPAAQKHYVPSDKSNESEKSITVKEDTIANVAEGKMGSGMSPPKDYLTAIGSKSGEVKGVKFIPDKDAILEAIHVGKTYEARFCGEEVTAALKDFNLSIRPGEIVSIVGRNGSGKTTLAQLIIGTEDPTRGVIKYRHKPIFESDIFDNVGYSTEHGLWKYVTVEQHLRLYAALKGIEEEEITKHIKHFMTAMDFDKDRKRCVIRCSGGTRKKVHNAIALIGHPEIIVLDEPTSGLDTFSKRLVWDFLLEYCSGEKTIVMTTPWLEEAEALGTQIGFLEKGILSSCGTYEDLKLAGEKHYTLKIRLKIPESIPDQKKQLAEMISIAPGAKFQERFLSRFIFDIPNPDGRISIKKLYMFLESRRGSLGIIQYTISNNTLGKYIF